MSKKTQTQENILKAAAEIINTGGVLSLTLEAVAKKAGVSKGGLLYHYPSKYSLMDKMARYLMQNFVKDVETAANSDPCEKGKWTRAYTALTFSQLESHIDMNTAFLAAVATNPRLLPPVVEAIETLQARIENDGLSPVTATIIRLAVDGVYYNRLYGMGLTEDTLKEVTERLISLTKEANR
jgi:AcrR family transcriptional regulator